MKLQQWAQGAEIVASIGVVVTLVILVQEVRWNTRALERQSDLDRAQALTTPFFEAPELASVLAKIKSVDGNDPIPQAFIDRYELTPEEAILWERHLWLVWLDHEAEFERSGPSPKLEAWIRGALASPDNRTYWGVARQDAGPGFRAFVDALAADSGG
ncbi:MAG: hypothetical protein LJF04_08350 [Gemmatimonadetes bacterium]|nr:hypothetical protein [Gemmatimonadota bacterium]